MHLLLGVDCGTSGCKVTLIDEQGLILATAARTYSIHYRKPGWAEQSPQDWVDAACEAIRECLDGSDLDTATLKGMSVTGPAHNVALMDEDDGILRPTIHWSDLRSIPQSEWLEEKYGDRIFKISYQRTNPSWTLSQLLWLKQNEYTAWSKLRRIQVTKDYVTYCLTGEYKTDFYDAVGTQLFDVEQGTWSKKLCDIIEFPTEWLPDVLPAHTIAGRILPEFAKRCGLPPGLPVAVGSGDSVVEALGIGILDPGQGVVKLGTSANIDFVISYPEPTSKGLTYPHVVPGLWFVILATNSGAATLRWFVNTFFREQSDQEEIDDNFLYDHIYQVAQEMPAGCDGLICHPYLMGERAPYFDPYLRGDFIGIRTHHSFGHFARAVLEGVAFSIRDCLLAAESLGQPIHELNLMGGGAKSDLWSQIICDVLGRPIIKPTIEDASYGAALLAGIATGVFSDWEQARGVCVQDQRILHPDEKHHMIYNRIFEIYRKVTRDMIPNYHQLEEMAHSEEIDE